MKPFFPATRDLPPSTARAIADGVLNLVYPECCFICGHAVARQRDCSVCQRCWQRLAELQIPAPWCSSCGLPLHDAATPAGGVCIRCSLETPEFSGARAFGYYTSELRRVIHGLKFESRRNLVGLLAPLLAATFLQSWERSEIDLVLPVPLHPRRKRERGFNQAALLGRAVTRLLALPYSEKVLVRALPTAPQTALSHGQRLRNVAEAFVCRRAAELRQARVLLIDDIMTTGATVASASRALLKSGARRVSVLTVARAVMGVE